MQKRAQVAVSALISISAALLPAGASNPKRSVAMVSPMVPIPAPHSVAVKTAVQRSDLQRLARGAYPVNHLQRAALLKQRGDLDGALVEFLKAAQENPLQVKAYYEQAVIFKQRGYNKLAQSALQQALAVKPDYRDARVLLASLYLETGDLSQAASELFRSLGLSSGEKLALPKPLNAGQGGVPSEPPAASLGMLQTPHGHLASPPSSGLSPVPRAEGNQSAHTDAFSAPVKTPAETIGNTQRAIGKPAQSAVVNTQRSSSNPFASPGGSRLPGEQTAINELLRGIPGVDPDVSTDPQAPGVDGSGATNGTAGGAQAPTPAQLATNQAETQQQVQDIFNRAEKDQGFSFHLPNLLSLFKVWPSKQSDGAKDAAKQAAPAQPTVSEKQIDKQVDKLVEKAQAANPAQKKHVAGWFSKLSDEGHGVAGQTLGLANEKPLKIEKKRKGDSSVNPVEMLVRQANQSSANGMPDLPSLNAAPAATVTVTDSFPEGIKPGSEVEQKTTSSRSMSVSSSVDEHLPPTGIRVENIKSAAGAPVIHHMGEQASEDKGSWMPNPVDFSKFVKRAVSLMALPIVKGFEMVSPAPSLPGPTMIGGNNIGPPVPALPGNTTTLANQSAPIMSPQANVGHNADAFAAPTSLPRPTEVAAAARGPQAVQSASAQSGLDSVMQMLPKDIAAGLEQVLAPKPVNVAQASNLTPPPQVQPVNIEHPDASSIPSPVPSIRKEVFENLVTARVGPDAVSRSDMNNAAVATNQIPTPAAPMTMQRPVMAPVTAEQQAPTTVVAPESRRQNPGRGGTVMMAMADSPPAPSVVPTALAYASPVPAMPIARPVAAVQTPVAQNNAVNLVPKVSTPVAQRLAAQGFKFVAPTISNSQQPLVNSLRAGQMKTMKPVQAPVAAAPAVEALPEDAWAKRMKYLLANGTSSLGPGEAFMFSEETGEGVLFLHNGNTIRRKIALPEDAEKVARMRRPELVAPKEMQYNLSLLGKIIKRDDSIQNAPVPTSLNQPMNNAGNGNNMSINDILGKSDGFFGWLKNVFKM